MLSIQPIGSSGKQLNYYTGFGQQDYYCKNGEPPGLWFGKAQSSLGIAGRVSREQFGNLLGGRSADGTRKLVQNAGRRDRRSAFDLTFSVPKSVSVAWGLSDAAHRREIEQAASDAVLKVMETVEEYCGISRRGKQGERTEKAKLLAALFRHDTSRALEGQAPDPNLHWHCVLLNLSVRPDGTTGSLDARELFRPHMKMALGALFRTELSKNLGLESYRPIQNDKQVSWFELRGVPTELLKTFSKRRGQIESWLEERSLSGAKAAEKAAQVTRRTKQKWSRNQLDQAWNQVGSKHNFTYEQLISLHSQRRAASQADRQSAVVECVEDMMQSQSYFTHVELIRHVAERFQTWNLGIDAVKLDVASMLTHSNEIVRLDDDAGMERYTTKSMLELERQLISCVQRSRGRWACQIDPVTRDGILKKHPSLRPEQNLAIEHIVFGSGTVACVNGMAGTGKTFMLSIAHELWKTEGRVVLGTALAARAAANLETETGISSLHIHSLLKRLTSDELSLPAGSVLLVDEAGMIGTRLMHQLVHLVEEAEAKLVLVGDYKQLQAIDAGGPFRALTDVVGVAELNQIIRQREGWARQAVTEFSVGNAESALHRYFDRGLLTIASDRRQAMQQLVKEWSREQSNRLRSIILAGSRLETTILNRLCQEKLFGLGILSTESMEIGGERFHVGDRVMFTRNNGPLMIRNGCTGTMAAVDASRQQVCVDLDDRGVQVVIKLEQFSHLALGYAATTHKSQGLTVDSAFVLAGGGMTDRELTYVQTSRARGTTRIYTDEESAGECLSILARQMKKSRAKDLAHDYAHGNE